MELREWKFILNGRTDELMSMTWRLSGMYSLDKSISREAYDSIMGFVLKEAKDVDDTARAFHVECRPCESNIRMIMDKVKGASE